VVDPLDGERAQDHELEDRPEDVALVERQRQLEEPVHRARPEEREPLEDSEPLEVRVGTRAGLLEEGCLAALGAEVIFRGLQHGADHGARRMAESVGQQANFW
jgi:hypothetical protein